MSGFYFLYSNCYATDGAVSFFCCHCSYYNFGSFNDLYIYIICSIFYRFSCHWWQTNNNYCSWLFIHYTIVSLDTLHFLIVYKCTSTYIDCCLRAISSNNFLFVCLKWSNQVDILFNISPHGYSIIIITIIIIIIISAIV